jgi:hypothetical protein
VCVIIYKPKGIELPNKEVIHNCWWRHDDGAGVYTRGVVDKGFMKEDDLVGYLASAVTKEDLAVIHFRTGTSGEKTAPYTHPFPLSKRHKQLGKLHYKVDKPILFHNGVLRIKVEEGLSDTSTFAKAMGTMKLDAKQIAVMMDLVLDGDRGIVIFPNEAIVWSGKWEKDEGCYFSNGSYKPYTYAKSTTVCSGRSGYATGYGYGGFYGNNHWDAAEKKWLYDDDEKETNTKVLVIGGDTEAGEITGEEGFVPSSKNPVTNLEIKQTLVSIEGLEGELVCCPYASPIDEGDEVKPESIWCTILETLLTEDDCKYCSQGREMLRELIDDLCMLCEEQNCDKCKYIDRMVMLEKEIDEMETKSLEREQATEEETKQKELPLNEMVGGYCG